MNEICATYAKEEGRYILQMARKGAGVRVVIRVRHLRKQIAWWCVMKLWIDDVRKPPKGWAWVTTYRQAVACLESGAVRQVSFDHDLGEGRTGYDVAAWIEERAAKGGLRRMRWSVHSKNPVGKVRIVQAMRSAERFWTGKPKFVGRIPRRADLKVVPKGCLKVDGRGG